MRLPRISLLLGLSIPFVVLLLSEVQEADSIYAYAVKGFVKDLRLNPTRFIGNWFYKKAFILKKLKLKWKLKKKLILKKLLLKKLLILKLKGVALVASTKTRGGINIFAPKIIVPILPRVPPRFAHGWGPLRYWTRAPLAFFRRKKRAIRFPEDEGTSQSQSQSNNYKSNQNINNHGISQPQHYSSNSDFFQNINFGSLGLSQSDLEQLKRLPDNLKYEYGQEMQELEAAASEPKEEEIQNYLSMASEFDSSSCIPKSICEIMTKGNRTSNPFENEILEYYNDPESRETGTPAYDDYAASLGKSTHDSRTCTSHFPNCQDTHQTMNLFMNEVFTPEACEPYFPDFNDNLNTN